LLFCARCTLVSKSGENQFCKPTQQIVFARERRSTLYCDIARGHVGAPPYVPYPHRARTARRRSDHRSLCCVSVNSPVTFMASDRARWRQSTGPAHHPRRAIGRRGDARRRPCRGLSTHACVTGVTPPTHNRPSPTISRPPRPLPRAHAQPPPKLRRPPLAPRPLSWPSEHA
jgi:hypothetical protein